MFRLYLGGSVVTAVRTASYEPQTPKKPCFSAIAALQKQETAKTKGFDLPPETVRQFEEGQLPLHYSYRKGEQVEKGFIARL